MAQFRRLNSFGHLETSSHEKPLRKVSCGKMCILKVSARKPSKTPKVKLAETAGSFRQGILKVSAPKTNWDLAQNLNIDGVFGISNIIAILAPEMQGPCTFGINLHMSRIRQVSNASLKFQAKAPEIAEAVAAEAVEVLLLRKVFVFLPDELQEIVLLKWPFGNPCDSIKFAFWVGTLPPNATETSRVSNPDNLSSHSG